MVDKANALMSLSILAFFIVGIVFFSMSAQNQQSISSKAAPLAASQLGDCNSDRIVDALDLEAISNEIFDGDGLDRVDVGGGTYPGNTACDANRDKIIDAGDLSCAALIISDGPGSCN